MAIEVGTAYLSVLPSTKGLASAIRKELGAVQSETDATGTKSGRSFASRFAGAAGGALKGVVKGGLLAGITGASLLGGAGLKTAAELEQSRIGFETMLGSAAKADKFLAKIQKTAASTPFELPGLTQASQKLLAFGFDVRDVIPTLTTLGDAASGLGLGQEGLDRIIMAVGQMQAKGKVSSEELLQLTEAGIPALKILANQYGMTAADMQAAITKGTVSADKAIPALLKGIKKGSSGLAGETAKFGGLMSKQSQSLSGLFSTMKDTVLVGMANALTPLIPMIKSGLRGAIASLPGVMTKVSAGFRQGAQYAKELAQGWRDGEGAGGTLRSVVTGIASTLGTLFQIGSKVVSWANENRGAVVALAAVFVTLRAVVIAYTISQKAAAAGSFATMILNLVKGLSLYQNVAKVATAVQWAWNAAITSNPIGLIVVAIAAFVAAIVVLWKKNDGFRAAVLSVWSAIKNGVTAAVNAVVNFVKGNWQKLLVLLTGPIGAAALLIVKHWGSIKSGTSSAVNAVKTTISSVWGGIKDVVSKIWNGVKNAVDSAWDGIKAVVSGGVNAVQAYVHGVTAVVGIVRNAFESARSAVSQKITAVVSLVRGLPGKITGALGNAGSILLNAGSSIIQGLIDGIDSKIGAVTSKLKALTNKIPDWKGPAKRDKTLLTANGRLIMQGLIKGLKDGEGGVHKILADFTNDLSKKQSLAIAKALGAGSKILKKGKTDAQQAFILSTISSKALSKEFAAATEIAKKRKAKAKEIETATDALEAAVKLRDDFVESVRASAVAWAGAASFQATEETPLDAANIVQQMRDRLAAIKTFKANLQTLLSQGLDETTYQSLVEQGVEAGGALASALVKDPAAVKAVADLSGQINTAAGGLGKDTGGHLFQAGVDSAQKVLDGLKIDDARLATKADTIAKKIAKALREALKVNVKIDDLMPSGAKTTKPGKGGGSKPKPKPKKRAGLAGVKIYDNGGILEPGALAYNASRKPEAVFNHRQFAQYAAAAKSDEDRVVKQFNYYAAEGSSLGSEEDLFAAVNRARMVGF